MGVIMGELYIYQQIEIHTLGWDGGKNRDLGSRLIIARGLALGICCHCWVGGNENNFI